MQDMATMQQHSITSPAPASTIQNQDSPMDSIANANCDAQIHHEASRTGIENQEDTLHTTKINNEVVEDNTMNEEPMKETSSNKNQSNEDNETSCEISKNEISRTKSDRDTDNENMEECQSLSEGSEMRYVCPICDTVLSSQHDFTLHIRSHNNLSPVACVKTFACKICSKVLSSSSSLDRHVLVHSGERPFKCRICGVAFTTNGNMHRHMRTHNSPTSKSESYESDGSTDSTGSFNSKKSPLSSPPPSNCVTKKRRVGNNVHSPTETNNNKSSGSISPPSCLSPNGNENGNKRKLPDLFPVDADGESPGRRRKATPTSHQDSPENLSDQSLHCPVCEREDFASLNVLETHLEESHPEYQIKCHVCDQIFKNHRVLNLHRSMAQHEKIDKATKPKNNSHNNAVLGFKDLTFVDFSSKKFPHIAVAVCEKSLHKPSSTLKFQCNKCDRAFPCISALNIHQEADICSDGDAPTDLTSNRRRISSAGESEEEIEERKREDFFAGLDLQNKSVPSSPSVTSDHYRPKKEDYESSLYYNPVNGERNDIGVRNMESGKDLADIQSIISVTSASGLIQDLSKSPPQISTMSPDCGGRGSILDSGGGEEEQQDCFAAEFRRMKLKGEFPCRLCTTVFPNLRALKGHNRSHLSSSVGIFRCNMCPYSNPDKATTVRHMRNHNGDRPYECSLCNYAFTTKANCERHLRNRHSKLSREEVKKSIIYHPSEDPTNDPDLPSKLQSREEVKRSLVFSTQHSSSLEELNSNEHSSSFQHSIDDHKNNYALEDNLSPNEQFEESRHSQSPHLSIVDRRVIDLKQVRPWEKTQEVATMTTNVRCEDIEEQETSRGSSVDRRAEPNENISSIEALVNLTKNNNNPFPKLPVIENQRLQTKEVISMSEIPVSSVHHHMSSYPSPTSDADSPLDLSMDALDLSKKKDSYPKNFRSISPTKDTDDAVPQDLSTKSSQNNEYNNRRSPSSIFTAKPDQNMKGNSILAQQILSSNSRGTTMSPQQHSPSPTAPAGLHPAAAGFYGNPQLNHLYLNNNGFPFHQAQPPFAIHPYFIPSTHTALIPNSNIDDFRSRLQKELINNLQLSGGTIFDSVMVSAAERLQAIHQQAYQDYSRGKPEAKVEENRQPPVKELDKSTPNVVINKPAPVTKVSVAPKSMRERDNSSVKMVIKNGVLMPKQKQRRYRTERPFACEHCSARFTLRSNMERHIKQQHPQYWTQRQRSNVGGSGPGRRSHAIPTSLTANLNITNHQDTAMKNLHSDGENLLSQSKSPHIPTVINIPEPPTEYQISNVIRDNFHSVVSDADKVILPKIKDELSSDSVLPDKTKDHSSIINNNNNNNNNNNYNKAFISEEVKLAIAQQLKSKLNHPINPLMGEEFERRDTHNQENVKKGPDEDNDDENELIIDEEKEVEEETIEDKEPKQETKEKFREQSSGTSSSVKDVDLASVSRLLDNATTQTQAFQRYFRGTQDGEEGLEGSEEDEEGLVAGSNSEGNNSGSDENKSEGEQSSTSNNNNNSVEKKKSAYSLAPNRVSCPYCFRKFPWSSSLRRHVLTHTGQKPYKCPHCPLLFTTKSNCDRHLLRKHGGQSGSTASQGGGSSSSSETSPGSNTNNYTMRNVPERPFKCNYCPSSTFSTQSNLKKHVQTKHSPASPGSAAHLALPRTVMSGDEGCNASTAGSSRPESRFGGDESHGSGSEDAGDDRGNAHSSSEADHGTPRKHEKDERTSYLSAALESHRPLTSSSILEATVLGVKPYSTQAPSLPESHTGTVSSADLPFKCHLCEGSYAERQEALEHIRENHPSEFELLMSKGALDSNSSAATEDNNNVSSAVSHTDEGNAGGEESLEQLRGKFPDYANRKVMCAFCMRRFWSAEDLRRHMRTHTGERPFSCDICRRRFTLKHSMLRHRKKHNNSTALFNVSTTSSEDTSIVSGDEDHPSSGTSLHSMLQSRTKKQHADDATAISGDEEPTPGSVINSDIAVGKPVKLALKMTNHNNNNITNTAAKGIKQWDGDSENFTASAAARILSSKFSTVTSDRKEDADDDNTGTDLIGNLLGIQGSIIDKVLQSKSAADEAAKLLGVQNGANQE